MKMRNYLSNIFAAIIVFMVSIINLKAQTLSAKVSWPESASYTPCCNNDVWHIVEGTTVTITLGTSDQTTNDPLQSFQTETGIDWDDYNIYIEDTVIYYRIEHGKYKKLQSEKDEFMVTADTTMTYHADIYEKYIKTPDNPADFVLKNKTAIENNVLIKFKAYPIPSSVVDLQNAITVPQRKYSYVGQDVTYQYKVTALDNRYRWEYTWTFNGENKTGTSAQFNNPSAANTFLATLSVQAKSPDGSEDWGQPIIWQAKDEDRITVLPAPSTIVSENDLQDAITPPTRKYSYVGQDATYQYAVAALDGPYQWEYTWTFNGENKTGTSAQFNNPSTANTFLATLSVQAKSPDGSEDWGQPIIWQAKDEDKIIVLPAPSSVVSTNKLQNAITVSRKYSYIGQDVTYQYEVTALDNRYQWVYTWTFNGENKTGTSAQFNNPSDVNTYPATLSVQAKSPDGKEVWGQPITCQTKNEDKITVLPAPSTIVSENDLQDAIKAPTRKYSYVGQDVTYQYKVTALDNRYQWEYTWTFNGENKTGTSAQFNNPSAAKTYSATLSIQAKSPDGSEDWGQPIIWQAKDEDKITVLPAPSSVVAFPSAITLPTRKSSYVGQPNVSYEYAVTALDNRYQWEYTWTFNGENKTGTSAQFNNPSDVNTYPATLSVLAKSPDGKEVWGPPITYTTSEEDDNVVKVYPKPSNELKTNIPLESENKYLLEICEDETLNHQDIILTLAGGDPQKWNVTISPDTNCPSGTLNSSGYKHTFSIKGTDLKSGIDDAKTYNYNIKVQYVDGDLELPEIIKNIEIKVWPKPEITPSLALEKNGAAINYSGTPSQNKFSYFVSCYEGDELVLSVEPSNTGVAEEYWEYVMGSGNRMPLPTNKLIPITQEQGGSGPFIIHFYNKLKKKEVLSVEMNINRFSIPTLPSITLPNVDNTTSNNWSNAENNSSPVDLYGGGTQTASFNFSPKTGDKENINGWTYSCNKGNIVRTGANAKWDYNVITSTNSANEIQAITIEIKNSIPSNGGAENIGFSETKTYYIRAWREITPPLDYTLSDENTSNNVKSTHGIREGNNLIAHVNSLDGGYNPGGSGSYYDYSWEGQGSENKTDWTKTIITNSNDRNVPERSKTTYKLTVRNKGPRGTYWVEKSYTDCDVYVYNRPKTPTKLTKKGNGTSGTMIIEYNNISDDALLASGDYVIDFCYTDVNGEHKIIAKPQTEIGDIRWATGYSGTQIDNAFVYAHWLDAENGVLITSGKRTPNSVDEFWDNSMYNLTPNQISEIRALTRAGDGNYTAIQSIRPDDMIESDICVYNMNGMMVGSSTKGLKSGFYIIRFLQDGIMKSMKVSVK